MLVLLPLTLPLPLRPPRVLLRLAGATTGESEGAGEEEEEGLGRRYSRPTIAASIGGLMPTQSFAMKCGPL